MRRALRWIVVAFVAGFLFWSGLRVRQYIFRTRVMRLQADVLSLGDSSPDDSSSVQAFIERWQHLSQFTQSCQANECSYTVRLGDPLPDGPDFVYVEGPHVLGRIFDHVGLRASSASAYVDTENGQIVSKSFSVRVALPVRDWIRPSGMYWPELAARIAVVPDLKEDLNGNVSNHPDRIFFMRRIMTEADITPATPSSERSALWNFNLRCITQIVPCRQRAQLSPEIEKEYEEEMRSFSGQGGEAVTPSDP